MPVNEGSSKLLNCQMNFYPFDKPFAAYKHTIYMYINWDLALHGLYDLFSTFSFGNYLLITVYYVLFVYVLYCVCNQFLTELLNK